MLQVARLSPKLLGDSAGLIHTFIASQFVPGGGFADRAGRSDLYYTVFGLESLVALQKEIPSDETRAYLAGIGDGESLDFVHLSCLARCWSAVASHSSEIPVRAILRRLETYRSADGGYSPTANNNTGTAYGAYLALAAYEDLREPLPEAEKLLHSLQSLRASDRSYSNVPHATAGLTTSTAAAVMLMRHLGETPDACIAQWLLARAHPQGGFAATPDAPIPDLLSTATALHALSAMHAPIDSVREPCLDFIDSLWTNRGGFHGHWADDEIDCEYTYYGLLALGHLSL